MTLEAELRRVHYNAPRRTRARCRCALSVVERAKLHRIRGSRRRVFKSGRHLISSRSSDPEIGARSVALSPRVRSLPAGSAVRRRRHRNARQPLPPIVAIRGGRAETRGEQRKRDGAEMRARERDRVQKLVYIYVYSISRITPTA